eukprot:m.94411 g.94411  ORF g.94411 m.94411 type:complete len:172 (+) comp12246_c0_seq1:329-844(+)
MDMVQRFHQRLALPLPIQLTTTIIGAVLQEPEKLIAEAKKVGAQITTVLTTHNHWDHAGGNKKIAKIIAGLEIFGGRGDGAEGVTKEVGNGDVVDVGKLKISVIETPCHTVGHVCYYVNEKAVFTGDTLFVAGCGSTCLPIHLFKSGTSCRQSSKLVVTTPHFLSEKNAVC